MAVLLAAYCVLRVSEMACNQTFQTLHAISLFLVRVSVNLPTSVFRTCSNILRQYFPYKKPPASLYLLIEKCTSLESLCYFIHSFHVTIVAAHSGHYCTYQSSFIWFIPGYPEQPWSIRNHFNFPATYRKTETMASENGLYPYKPSQFGAVIFTIAFGSSAAIHLYQMIRGRAWFYCSFTMGAISKD